MQRVRDSALVLTTAIILCAGAGAAPAHLLLSAGLSVEDGGAPLDVSGYSVPSTADWNGDGLKTYAPFIPHLWQTIDGKGNPVRTRFIPRKLAFAVGPATASDGYYYELLHQKGAIDKPRLVDYQNEWALVARPAKPGQTGRVVFMCSSGRPVLAGPLGIDSRIMPLYPEREGWKAVRNSENLNAFLNEKSASRIE